MSAFIITTACRAHITHLAQNMREADKREVWASHRQTPQEALEVCLENSELAWACLMPRSHAANAAEYESGPASLHTAPLRPAFMWGVARCGTMLGNKGAPWLLASDDILRVKWAFLRRSRYYVAQMQARFPRLENYVHAQNALSINWLRWCGFSVTPEAHIFNGELFYRFEKLA